jgi:prepilin signal peptidase PulO-like enzyme (type II secretory pathway)
LLGALVGGSLMMAGRIGRRAALPFGVFLATAGVCTLFIGQGVWAWYLRLIGAA